MAFESLLFPSCHAGERVTRKAERPPVVERPGANLFVECNCQLIPVEHGPIDSAAIARDGDARELA